MRTLTMIIHETDFAVDDTGTWLETFVHDDGARRPDGWNRIRADAVPFFIPEHRFWGPSERTEDDHGA